MVRGKWVVLLTLEYFPGNYYCGILSCSAARKTPELAKHATELPGNCSRTARKLTEEQVVSMNAVFQIVDGLLETSSNASILEPVRTSSIIL